LVVAILWAAYACLNYFSGWGVLSYALITVALVFLLVLAVHSVKARKPKRLQEECERVQRERKLRKGERKRLKKERKRFEEERRRDFATHLFVWIVPLLVLLVALFAIGSYPFLRNWPLVGLAVGLPTVQVLCLAVGMDRLHNYYSQVQARIVGAAKKQEESQTQKFADILTDPKAQQSFIKELMERQDEIGRVLRTLRGEKP
jgi:heme exporter protein D